MRIVAWRMGFAGDILFSTAALEGIKQKHPKAELTYGVWKQYYDLIETNPHIDRFVHGDGVEEKIVGHDSLGLPRTKRIVHKDGLVYARRRADKEWEVSHEEYKLPEGEMAYWGRIHAMQAADLGLLDLNDMESFKPQVYLASTDVIEKPPKKVAALGVFSKNGADSRLWRMHRGRWDVPDLPGLATAQLFAQAMVAVGEKWEFAPNGWPELVRGLNGLGFQCVQLGGKTDPRVPGAVDLCGRLSWRQSVGVVMNADVCITIDSFLLHAAVAQKRALDGSVLSDGTPTVAILGPTDGRAMFPEDAERVVEVQARQTADCPCFHSSRFGKGECEHGNSCMKSITVGQILEGIERCFCVS